ncbi:MAG: hypothetical protein ACM3ST_01525 [Bdellovibrio bacteriovorus]
MRKAIANGNPPGKEGSGRRYWMRATPLALKTAPAEASGKRPPKARFLEPYRLSEERRHALIGLLAEGGVGDGESRELFASAIEYDIATARQALTREPPGVVEPSPPPVVAEPAVEVRPGPLAAAPAVPEDLADITRALAQRIADLDVPVRDAILESLQEQDRFRRRYDGSYLEALCAELGRLADALASRPESLPPPTSEPPVSVPPPLGEGARRFLRRVARVYEEVLEARADPQSAPVFGAVLSLVSMEAGLSLPREPALLTEVLKGA